MFRQFDPTSSYFSLNWLTLSIPLVIIPLAFKIMPYRIRKFKMIRAVEINKEIGPHRTRNINNIKMFINTLFYFICVSNIFGLLPYIYTPTSIPLITLSISLVLWLNIIIYAWIISFKIICGHLLPASTPLALSPFIVLIELISLIIRPFTLSIRLTANIIAGHLLITLLSSMGNHITGIISIGGFIIAQNLLVILEIAVAIIQGYIFMLLFTIYTSEI